MAEKFDPAGPLRLGSVDTFLMEDSFWQDKMGKPVVNQDFLCALLRYGSFESFHVYCSDTYHMGQFRNRLERLAGSDGCARVKLSLQADLLGRLREAPPDVMHQGDFTYHMPHLMELRNRLDLPTGMSGITHSLDGAFMQTRFIQLLLARPRPYDSIVCTSDCAKRLLEGAFQAVRERFSSAFGAHLPEPPRLEQIPLGLSDGAFQNMDRVRSRTALGIPADHFVMLSLARFSPRHKMDLAPILEMIQWLKSGGTLPAFTLVLAGSGKETDLHLVREMVSLLGLQKEVRIESNVSVERKMALYGAADVFLSPVDNYQETFGVTMIEAMSQGLPIVASDFSGYKELVAHGRTGFLVPTCSSGSHDPWESLMGLLDASSVRFYQAQKISVDLQALAGFISSLAVNPGLRREMGFRARTRAMRYHWSVLIPLYEEMWKRQRERARRERTAPVSPAHSLPVLIPSIEGLFGHFPSRRLRENDVIRLTPYGRDRCRQGFQPVLYEDMRPLLDERRREFILRLLLKRDWTLEGITGTVRSEFACSSEEVVHEIDWLMKHGYLSHPADPA